MHCLEVIIARNQLVAATSSHPTPPQLGWEVTHDGHGRICVSGHERQVVIDCSDPLQDAELVRFHREHRQTLPDWVRYRVETLASEYRRYIIVAAGIGERPCI